MDHVIFKALMIAAPLSVFIGMMLFCLSRKNKKEQGNSLINEIDLILPQTQCGQCAYPGCRPYAEAIAHGLAPINLCPPGGEVGIQKLADLLGCDFLPFGEGSPSPQPKSIAIIDEALCIGCTLCIQACPVDAILGAAKHMHTVISSECTGCELCITPCPVDCISMNIVSPTVITIKV
jgi:electron transport complex protein RnfB